MSAGGPGGQRSAERCWRNRREGPCCGAAAALRGCPDHVGKLFVVPMKETCGNIRDRDYSTRLKARIITRPGCLTCCATPSLLRCKETHRATATELFVMRLWSWHLGSAPRARFVEVKSERDNLARRRKCIYVWSHPRRPAAWSRMPPPSPWSGVWGTSSPGGVVVAVWGFGSLGFSLSF